MDITQIKLDFSGIPFVRKIDIVSKAASKIIVCSANEASIDIGLYHEAAKKQGYPGIIHHYIIKNNDSYDGVIYYCRPRIYQNDLPYNTPSKDSIINNSITVCVAGLKGQALTAKQKESLINLLYFLTQQEMTTCDSVMFLHEMTNSTPEIPEWSDIKDQFKALVADADLYKSMINQDTNNGVKTTGTYDQIVTTSQLNSFDKISTQINVPVDSLETMNKQIPDPDNIAPNTAIFIPDTPYSSKLKSAQQRSISGTVLQQISQQVTYSVIEKEKYIEAQKAGAVDIYDIAQSTTQYGGKKRPIFYDKGIEYPGYHNAFIQLYNPTDGKTVSIQFLVSPSSSNDARSNTQQISKTSAGWFIMKTGKNPSTLAMTGYMLDIKNFLERHEFLEKYKQYIEDSKNERFEYTNDYLTKVVMEGREYYGYMQSLTFSKSAVQPFLYQYNMSFIILNDKMIYNANFATQSINTIEKIARIKQISALATINKQNYSMARDLYDKLSSTSNAKSIIVNNTDLPNFISKDIKPNSVNPSY